ncbi:MAG: hypothetical protein JWQ36_2964 [Enterovirga sp.]|jgi:uncharacterized protein (TIGR00645 family)|nr:hypothetical protein [Enterovirga sp.]
MNDVGGRAEKRGSLAERAIEFVIFSSRWLLAPFYVGLVLALVVLLLKFLQELFHFISHPFRVTEAETILGVLTLVDLTFTGSLVVIVVFSGYENFVSKIDVAQTRDWPEWMAKIDFTGLKLKLMSSIVAISAIQLLKIFMDLKSITDREIAWYVGLHVVFVISGLVFALTDRIGEAGHGKAHADKTPPHL